MELNPYPPESAFYLYHTYLPAFYPIPIHPRQMATAVLITIETSPRKIPVSKERTNTISKTYGNLVLIDLTYL